MVDGRTEMVTENGTEEAEGGVLVDGRPEMVTENGTEVAGVGVLGPTLDLELCSQSEEEQSDYGGQLARIRVESLLFSHNIFLLEVSGRVFLDVEEVAWVDVLALVESRMVESRMVELVVVNLQMRLKTMMVA